MTKLNDKIAVVTGAARGIGRAYAERLARDGADIVAVDLAESTETVAAVEALGRRAIGVRADVSSPDDVARAVAEAEAAFGPAHVLVNNAGIHPDPPIPFAEMAYADWRRMIAINLDSMFLFAKAVVPQMQARGWGRIINLTSSSVWGSVPNGLHYVSAKAGVVGFTRALATEVGAFGVTVNAIAPSLIRTPGTEGYDADMDEMFAGVAQVQSIKRPMTPDDLVGAVSFLASDDAALITAQVLHVDGGIVRVG